MLELCNKDLEAVLLKFSNKQLGTLLNTKLESLRKEIENILKKEILELKNVIT